MSDFDSGDLLAELFGVPPATAPAAAVPVAVVSPASDESGPEAAGGPVVDLWTADSIPIDEITPCPACGSYLAWWDALGRRRCGVCEAATLARGLRILRPVKSTTGRGPRCDADARADGRAVGGKRPTGGVVGRLAGREDGKGGVAKTCCGLRSRQESD